LIVRLVHLGIHRPATLLPATASYIWSIANPLESSLVIWFSARTEGQFRAVIPQNDYKY
jgi:hypothetical protein